MIYLLGCLFLMALYRFKGSAWPAGWDDTEKRIAWAVGLSGVNLAFNTIDYHHILYACAFPFLAFGAGCLPHAKFQSMGRTPGTTFLGCFLGMGAVGLASGCIIYLPALYFIPVISVGLKIGLLTLGMPLAYTVGYTVPWTLWKGYLDANTTEYGELFTGAAYFVSVIA